MPKQQLGDKYVGRFTQMLQNQPNANNGTGLGALAHAIQSGLLGYSQGQDAEKEDAAYSAFNRGANAKPWVNPDTGETVGTAGGIEGALAALGDQQGNPVAGRLARDLTMNQMDNQRSDNQWQQRFDAQQGAQNERLAQQQQFQNTRMDRQFAQQDKNLASQLAGKQQVAQAKASTAGKFYAVQTGNGVMLLDKATGTAVMMGQDEQGNPVQIGQPFRPALNPQTQQPVATPTPDMLGGQNPPALGQPGAQPSPGQGLPPQMQQPLPPLQASPQGQQGLPPQVQQQSQQQAPQGIAQGVTPLMSPSIDPTAQENVRRAQKIGELQGKRIGSTQDRLKAATTAMGELKAQQGVMMQDIDTAINMAEQGGTGIGSYMSLVPGSGAHDLSATLDTIKANVGFDKLQAMREASPTGGALGQVSERENVLLQSTLGALAQTQSKEQFISNLQRLKGIVSERQALREQAFQTDFGQGGQPQQPAPSQPTTTNVDDLLQKYGVQ